MKKSFSKKQYLLFVGAIIPIIIATGWVLKIQNSHKQPSTTKLTVKTVFTQETAKSSPIEISGFVRGASRADVSPMASGTIVKILKREGAQVKKGEVLAIIKAEQLDAQISAAEAGVTALEKTLSDSKKYYDQLVDEAKTARDASPSKSADEAVRSAERGRDLQIQGAKTQLIFAQGSAETTKVGKNNFTLTAPFAGTITAFYGREGGFANFSMPLFNISTPNNLEIETYVTATDGKNIFPGSVATFKATSGAPLTGTITNVAPGSDSANFKTLVRIQLNDVSRATSLGDFLHGQIMVPRNSQGISIPRKAIVSRGGDQIVFILDENNFAKEQAIKPGQEFNGFVDISEGLSVNQKIVVEGQQYLLNGSATTPYESN